jgi:hypothetical protein
MFASSKKDVLFTVPDTIRENRSSFPKFFSYLPHDKWTNMHVFFPCITFKSPSNKCSYSIQKTCYTSNQGANTEQKFHLDLLEMIISSYMTHLQLMPSTPQPSATADICIDTRQLASIWTRRLLNLAYLTSPSSDLFLVLKLQNNTPNEFILNTTVLPSTDPPPSHLPRIPCYLPCISSEDSWVSCFWNESTPGSSRSASVLICLFRQIIKKLITIGGTIHFSHGEEFTWYEIFLLPSPSLSSSSASPIGTLP